MRAVDTLISIGGAMIALLIYMEIYMNQVLSGHLSLSLFEARHWTLQYIINIAGCMAFLSQLFYKETAKQTYYCYFALLITAVALTDFPIILDGGCQFITILNSTIFAHFLFREVNDFRNALLELHAERIAKLQ